MADDGKSAADLAAENELRREGIALSEKNLKIVKETQARQKAAGDYEAERLEKRAVEGRKSLQDQKDAVETSKEELTLFEKKNVSALNFSKKMEHQEEVANRRLEMLQEALNYEEKVLEAAKKGVALNKNGEKFTEEEIKAKEKLFKKNKRLIKGKKKDLDLGLKGIEQGKTMLKNIGAQALGQSKIGSALLKGGKGLHSMYKMAMNLHKAYQLGAISASMMTAALGIGIIIAVVAAIAKLIEFTIMLAVKTRDATVAFQRSTGAAAKFGKAIPDLEYNMRAVGVSMEEATAAQNALYTSTTDYTMASKASRDDLLKTTALMGEFGVSVETSAKIAQHATKGLGIGIGGADELLLGLSAHAQDIGVPISKMMDDFSAAGDQLKRFGSDGERVFKRLAMVQKVTGIEIARVLAITEKFDTFEGAAKQAGMLNAAIGGNMVNAMDLMMTTDPVERFSMIKDSIMDTVGSFDEMSYYQKKFYANAAGLKDVGELAAMMSGDFNALDGSIGQTSKDFEKQRSQAKNWQSTMDLLKNTLMAFLPTMKKLQKPLQDMLEAFADGEGPLQKLGESFELLMETALLPGMKKLPEFITMFIDKLSELGDWLDENKDAIMFFGKALMYALGGIGAALVVIYAPLGLLLYGLGELFLWLGKIMGIVKKKNSPSFLDLFTGGMLAASFKLAAKAIELFFAPIATLGKMLKSLGQMFIETFDFQWVKDSMSWLGKFLPEEMGKTTQGIRDVMGIASDSKEMTKINEQIHLDPAKSAMAKLPPIIDDGYSDVPERVAAHMAPLTATPKAPASGMEGAARVLGDSVIRSFNQSLMGRMAAGASGETVAAPAAAGAGSQTIQVSIPISIGKDPLGTVITEIVDGRLGTVSYQGMAGTAGL